MIRGNKIYGHFFLIETDIAPDCLKALKCSDEFIQFAISYRKKLLQSIRFKYELNIIK